jgi:hypothetical protein
VNPVILIAEGAPAKLREQNDVRYAALCIQHGDQHRSFVRRLQIQTRNAHIDRRGYGKRASTSSRKRATSAHNASMTLRWLSWATRDAIERLAQDVAQLTFQALDIVLGQVLARSRC